MLDKIYNYAFQSSTIMHLNKIHFRGHGVHHSPNNGKTMYLYLKSKPEDIEYNFVGAELEKQ